MKGKVKWFSGKTGFGFIETEEGTDLFVHYSAIKMNGYKTMDKGDKVEFETEVGPKGIQAKDVTVFEKALVEEKGAGKEKA